MSEGSCVWRSEPWVGRSLRSLKIPYLPCSLRTHRQRNRLLCWLNYNITNDEHNMQRWILLYPIIRVWKRVSTWNYCALNHMFDMPGEAVCGIVKCGIWGLDVSSSSATICVALGKFLTFSVLLMSSFLRWGWLRSSREVFVKIGILNTESVICAWHGVKHSIKSYGILWEAKTTTVPEPHQHRFQLHHSGSWHLCI